MQTDKFVLKMKTQQTLSDLVFHQPHILFNSTVVNEQLLDVPDVQKNVWYQTILRTHTETSSNVSFPIVIIIMMNYYI